MSQTFDGTAANAKLGAAVIGDRGRVVYLEGMAEWPAERVGSRVRVEGELLAREGSTRNERGEIAAGWEGTAVFLKNFQIIFLA